MPSAKVTVDDRFKQLGAGYERAAQRALGRAAAATVSAAKAAPTQYNIEPVKSSIKATPVHRIRAGWRIFVYADDYRAVFYEAGTYARRRKKLSPRYHRTARAERIAAETGSGVKAQRFLGKAVPVARKALIEAVQREFS